MIAYKVYIGGFNGEPASHGHGIFCVYRKVHNDLLHLADISHDMTQILVQQNLHEHIFSDHAHHHLLKVFNECIHTDNIRLDDLFAAKGQQLAG